MTYEEREAIFNKVEEYAKTQASKGFHFAYLSGMIKPILTDEQLRLLERIAK